MVQWMQSRCRFSLRTFRKFRKRMNEEYFEDENRL